MSSIYNISKINFLKDSINVNSRNDFLESKSRMFQHNRLDYFDNPEMNEAITLVPIRKSFTYYKKPLVKKKPQHVDKSCFSLFEVDKNNENIMRQGSLVVKRSQKIKYIDKGPETSSFQLFYNKKDNVVNYISTLFKYRNTFIDKKKNCLMDQKIISTVLPNMKFYLKDSETVLDKFPNTSKVSYKSFTSNYNKSSKVYNSKKINLNINNDGKHIKYSLTKNIKNISKNNNNIIKNFKLDKSLNYNNTIDKNFVNPISKSALKKNVEEIKKVIYRHDAKVVHMNVPKHNRCYESIKVVNNKVKPKEKIEEIDSKNYNWNLLNDSNESVALVKFGSDIKKNFNYLNNNYSQNLHNIFLAELGHVHMSINGKTITDDRSPQVILTKFTKLLPNISDRKLVSCFSQEGVLANAFFGIVSKCPDILKYTFYDPKISYKIHRINENTFESEICSITKAKEFTEFGVPYKDRKVHYYGMKSNVIFSKIDNPIIKNSYFVK
ncbi:hypothetical protein RJD23_02035 [Buchnera aphidicola (Ceratoglyphina bambusae)]|uniref:hypothetical protein n=1 Tax=Buchnera aphidicola TaxID=9 RepID=UPI0031B832A3